MYFDKEHHAAREIPDGFYAVDRGNGSFFIFRIRTRNGEQILAKAYKPGSRTFHTFGVIRDGAVTQTGHWQSPAVERAIVTAATRLLAGDLEDAGRMYARNFGRCFICNRTLTHPDSVATGIGPECAGTRRHVEVDL